MKTIRHLRHLLLALALAGTSLAQQPVETLTDPQKATMRSSLGLGTAATTDAAPGTTGNFTLVLEGDSITQGVTEGGATVGNYLHDRLATESYFTGRATIYNVGTAGDIISSVVSNYALQVYPRRPAANGGQRAVLLLNIGTNDSSVAATQLTNAAALLAYCAQAQTDGFEVWLCTLLPRNTSTLNFWSHFNNALRKGEGYDKLIDLHGLFVDTTTWTGDNLHPNNLGYRIIASHINGRAYDRAKIHGSAIASMARQNADAVAITGGTFSGSSVVSTGVISRTSTSTSHAQFGSQAIGAGSSRQWEFGHHPGAVGNLPANSFRLNYYNGTGWEFGLSGFSPSGGVIGNQMRIVPGPVAGLASLSLTTGNKAIVTDSLTPAVGSAAVAGGEKLVEVTYNGSAWIVTAVLN